MNKVLLVAASILLFINAQAQTPVLDPELGLIHEEYPEELREDLLKAKDIFEIPDTRAEPKQGYWHFFKDIRKSIKYPSVKRFFGEEGLIYISFIIDELGEIVEFKSYPENAFSKNALKGLKRIDEWEPAYLNGEPVRSIFVLPVKFELER